MADLGTLTDGAPLGIDVERLTGSHACIVANAGGGKSGLIRRLLETTHGRVQHIVLDIEDEFYTLREGFDYVIAGGDGGDVPASVASASDLALSALRHGYSLIVQLNDLGPVEAPRFVGAFLEAMLSAPRELWHPALVVIDEAHRFAPAGDTTDASAGVRMLTSQGRKRGFTAVLASQRISKIDANVRGDVNNWMLGRVGQTLDRNIMADQLGFTAREGREMLRAIEPRSFWGFGPAIAPEPVLFRVADVQTTPVRAGQAKVATPPAPEALREILAGLAKPLNDLPATHNSTESLKSSGAQLASEIDAIARLQLEVAGLRSELEAERDERTIEQGVGQQQINLLTAENRALREIMEQAVADFRRIIPAMELVDADVPGNRPGGSPSGDAGGTEGRQVMMSAAPRAAARPSAAGTAIAKSSGGGNAPSGALTAPQRRILNALGWWLAFGIDAPTVEQVGFIAGYTPGSGGFNNLRSSMRTAGLIDYPAGGRLSLTEAGRAFAEAPDTVPTVTSFHAAVRAKLSAPQMRLLDPVLAAYPSAITVEAVAEAAGYTAGSGGFNNLRSSLRTLDLIGYPTKGALRASDWLFPHA